MVWQGRRGDLLPYAAYPMQGCVDGIAGDHLLITPPAILTQEQIGWSVDQLRAAIQEASA